MTDHNIWCQSALEHVKHLTETVRASLLEAESLQGYFERIIAQEKPTQSSIPWLSQLGKDASFARGDCGPACLAMWMRYLDYDVTVDDVSIQSGLNRGFSFTMPAHLIRAARWWDLDLYWRRNLILEDLRTELFNDRLVIILVNYPSLEKKYDITYPHGHWLLLTGHTDGYFYYHDPYWLDDRGANIKISEDALLYAWNRNHLNKNSDRQALRAR